MKIVLIDDDAPALGLLAYNLSSQGSSIGLKMIVAIWTEDTSVPNDLSVNINASNKSVTTEVVALNTERLLVERLCLELKSDEPIAFVSDLNMEKIGLKSVQNGSWYDHSSGLRKFLSKANELGHAIFLHSGALNADSLVKNLNAEGVRAEKLTACFENKTDVSGEAKKVAAEIVFRLGGTSLEKLWGNSYACVKPSVKPSATSWFSKQSEPTDAYPVPHHWNQTLVTNDTYKSAICAGLAIPELPQEIWTEAFHESLKGIAGKYFVGSNEHDIDKRYSLLLGSVFVIAMLSYYNVHRNIDIFRHLFKFDKKLAMRPFAIAFDNYGPVDKSVARSMGIALLFAFEACFKKESKHDNGHLKDIRHTKDGLQLILSWEPIKLYNLARTTAKMPPAPPDGVPQRRHAKSAEAIAGMVSTLAYHPGRVLPGNFTIDIQVVAQT